MKHTYSLRWVLVFLFGFGILGWLINGSSIYARLVYLSLFLLGGGAIWTLFSLRGIQVEREARILKASVGDMFEERFAVANTRWPGCMWLEVINRSPLPVSTSSASGSRLLTSVGAHQKRFYTTRTMLLRRGAFPLGPTEFASGDPFGLFITRRRLRARETLVVLPLTVPITTFPPPPGILPGGKTIRQHTLDVTPHAAGIREYVPGDPMKRIHWPTTAHRGRFMVKEFEQDPQADIWFFLDAEQDKRVVSDSEVKQKETEDADWWMRRHKFSLPRDTFEYAVSATASLARYFLNDRRSVGLVCAAGKLSVVPADRGDRQEGKILETLAFLQPLGKLPLQGLVPLQAKQLSLGSGVILVTSSTRPELLLAVEDLQRRNLRPVVVLIQPESFGGHGDSRALAAGLLNASIPLCQVEYGDDLSTRLALPAVYYQRAYLSRAYLYAGK